MTPEELTRRLQALQRDTQRMLGDKAPRGIAALLALFVVGFTNCITLGLYIKPQLRAADGNANNVVFL